eukprot:14296323-Ditylum_brightwellii.AAC.1
MQPLQMTMKKMAQQCYADSPQYIDTIELIIRTYQASFSNLLEKLKELDFDINAFYNYTSETLKTLKDARGNAIDQWNATPKRSLQYRTPNEVLLGLSKRQTNKHTTFKDFHPFDCPVYVLDISLADDAHVCKWKPHSHV